jgi:Flp pilus assembly protein TadD
MGHDAVTLITSQATASPDESAIRNALLGIAFATSGNRRSALERLRETSAAVERIQNLHYWLACLYAALDDKGRAVAQLEEAYEHRQASILFAGVDPLMDPLRHDEAFRSFLSKMNLR